MTQMKRRVIGLILTLALLVSAFSVLTVAASAATDGIIEAAGWLESAYVEWAPISGAEGYNVYVASADSTSWTRIDDMLIREYADYWRADAVGLKAGSYQLKVVPVASGAEQSDKALITDTLTVLPHDRSGYGFVGGTASGAYNDDGTLRGDAQVIYVTANTAKTCTATVNGTVLTGLQTILDAKQKANATEPLCIRIIGLVTVDDLDHYSSSSEGLQIKGKSAYSPMNITIEGIGEDGAISGFGMLIRNCKNVEVRNLGIMNFMDDGISVDTDNSNLWLHNCDFFYGNPGSDSDQAKGDGTLDIKKSQYISVAYNHFIDSGKACLLDATTGSNADYISYHHNWFDHSDSRHPRVRNANVHVYNNYYDGVAKYGVGAAGGGSSVFVEANYFENTKYPMLTSMQGSDISGDGEGTFSSEDGGVIKSYGNVIVGGTFVPYSATNKVEYDAYVATSRDEVLPSSISSKKGGHTYSNFDTASDFYSYTPESAEQARETVKTYAGRVNGGDLKWEFSSSENSNYEIISGLKSKVVNYKSSIVSIGGTSDGYVGDNSGNNTGSGDSGSGSGSGSGGSGSGSGGGINVVFPAGSYIHNFHESGKDSTFFSISGNLSTSKGTITFNGMSLTQCLKMETETSIIFTASENGRLVLVFGSGAASKGVKIDGTKYSIGSDNILETTVSVGAHTITKGDSVNLYYMVYTSDSVGEVHKHAYVESVTTEPTCTATGMKTYTCSCNDSYTETIAAKGHNHTLASTVEATCTEAGEKTFTCSACGDSYTEAISAKGHSYSSEVTKEATCIATGVKTFTCGNCGDSYIETIDAKGHNFVSGACSICGAPESNEHEHSYTGSVAKPATCTDIGVMKYVCSCGEEYMEQIAAKGHTYVLSSTKEATCTENGQRAYACSCGSKYTEQINAKGHEYEESVTKEATCTEEGTKTFTCSCGNSYTESIAAKGHSFAEGVCSSCGEEEKKEDVTPEAPGDGNNDGEGNGTEDEEPEEKLNFFQRIFRAIANFFRRLFGLKTK